MRKDITLDEFLESNPELNKYSSDGLNTTSKLSASLNDLGVNCSVEVNVEVCDDGSYRYEYSDVRLTHPTLALYIKWDNRIKRYLVSEDSTWLLKNIDKHTIFDVRRTLTEPNKIGVLNTKKVESWVKYYEDLYNQLKIIDDCNALKKQAFIDSLEGLDVKWDFNGKAGEIVKNGISYRFKILETYVSQKVELHYRVPNSLQSFLELSDNKYKDK